MAGVIYIYLITNSYMKIIRFAARIRYVVNIRIFLYLVNLHYLCMQNR